LIPLRDSTRGRGIPAITWALIALCALGFWIELRAGPGLDELIHRHALIPARLLALVDRIGVFHAEVISPVLTSMFLHDPGNLGCHFFGNMLFLWIFGDNVEDRFGHLGFLAFYLLGGVAAALAQVAADPASTVPTIGASGAIAAVMGAYLVLHPGARIHSLVLLGFWITTAEVPALVYLGIWFAMQLLHSGGGGGVAWWAHIGGFAFGVLAVGVLGRRSRA
jgi:membrane associated rhomboid family serine protease